MLDRKVLLPAAVFILLGTVPLAGAVMLAAAGAAADASLFAFAIDDSRLAPDGREIRILHLLRYDFAGGALTATDTILSWRGQPFSLESQQVGIVQQRFLVTDSGLILDLIDGEMLYRGNTGRGRLQAKGCEGNRIILEDSYIDAGTQRRDFYYFDLQTHVRSRLESPGKWGLPGVPSPDSSRSVTVSSAKTEEGAFHFEKNQIRLHELSGESRLLASGYRARMLPHLSSFPQVPVLWLDSGRILTQRDTGDIVILHLDGTVEPVVTMDFTAGFAETDPQSKRPGMYYGDVDRRFGGIEGRFGGRFTRLADGAIVYTVSVMPERRWGTQEEHYLIDVPGRDYKRHPAPARELGHGFTCSSWPDPSGIRTLDFNRQTIDRSRFSPHCAKETAGYVAVPRYREGRAHPVGIKVWNAASCTWRNIDFQIPLWSTHTSILGWIANEP